MSRSNDDSWGRRRSMGIFPRSSTSPLTPISDGNADNSTHRRKRPASFFVPSPTPSMESKNSKDGDHLSSPKIRSRTLLKNPRPSSLLGSLRILHPAEEEKELASAVLEDPNADSDKCCEPIAASREVLYHGEVQMSGGVFRKRKDYLVLTEKHLIRFKSQSRAVETFPVITPSPGRSRTERHSSMHSVGSIPDLQSLHSHSSAEHHSGIPLRHITAVFRSEDGRPYFSIEVAYLDGDTNHAASMTLQLNDPRESEIWLSSIRAAVTKSCLVDPVEYPPNALEYAARKLEQDRDYDPEHFSMFKVVQRTSQKAGHRSSSDDLVKLGATARYLVLGAHKLHLLALPKPNHRLSTTSLHEVNTRESFALVALVSIHVHPSDDSFELGFRLPLRSTTTLYLASTSASDLAVSIAQAAEYLRPNWVEQPFRLYGPKNLEDAPPSNPDTGGEEYNAFDRTLIAYCAGYGLNTSNIRYSVEHDFDDGPRFNLLRPSLQRKSGYTAFELLAVLRALRYNESFGSISFAGISLDVLHSLRDRHGLEHLSPTSRMGAELKLGDFTKKSLLVQELQAIVLKSRRLRRVDFSGCVRRKPHDEDDEQPDPGSEVVEAVFPLCRKQVTNVDWITLNGIELDDTDLDYLVYAAVERSSHLRALEVSRCGLTDRSLQLILNAMLSQDATVESIDISSNLARLSPSTFQGQIGHFGVIRRLNLSRVHRTSGPEPLVAPETLLNWRLEELQLSETMINERTTDSIAAYLATPMSDTLRMLRLNQCGLTGRDVAVFMHAMSRTPGEGRNLHLYVSENRLEQGHDKLVTAIANGLTPSHLTMKMVEYKKEDHFRELVQALRTNTSLKYLDISKASLPYDANEETCEALRAMFAENTTLEELDISGEHAHLEVAKFGIGLNFALTGLKKNTALKVLRIEYQKLGLQGANTLSSVLEENQTLREVYCEHNEINLQGLTVLVNSMANNKTVCYLPRMDLDRLESLKIVSREIRSANAGAVATTEPKKSMRRSLSASVSTLKNKSPIPTPAPPSYTEKDVQDAMRMLNEKWDRQTNRLGVYLQRNHNELHGIDGPVEVAEPQDPNMSSTSLSGFLEKMSLISTSTAKEISGRDSEDTIAEEPTGEDELDLGSDPEFDEKGGLIDISETSEDWMDEPQVEMKKSSQDLL